jgi:hypothetical protein
MTEEIYKSIPGYENIYEVSNYGNVKSIKFGKEKILKPKKTRTGYLQVGLLKDGRKLIGVHQLVAMAFLNHTPCGMKLVIDHINDIKSDNRIINLQVVTQRENIWKKLKYHNLINSKDMKDIYITHVKNDKPI